MANFTCSFYGFGLIGGSIAKALKAARPDTMIRVCDVSADTLFQASEDGIADAVYERLDAVSGPEFCDCDVMFLCAPVGRNNENLMTILPWMKETSILTDVGSVKTPIHKAIPNLNLKCSFVGGHPMCGSERTGYVNSKPGLLENAYYILTPQPDGNPAALETMTTLVKDLGAIPLILDCENHDRIVAGISHVPHVIASSLVNLVKQSDDPAGTMKQVAAGGFKDITRIASSSTVMWQQICLTNGANIVSLLDDYIDILKDIRSAIDRHDAEDIYTFFAGARSYRDSFQNVSSGPLKRIYLIQVEIPDQTGSLADVVKLLARNDIGIKNINITHNRESADGVLRIEFHDEGAQLLAENVLTEEGYFIHRKKL